MFNGLGKDFTSKFYANSPVFSPDERQNIEWTDSGRALANIGVRPNTIRDIQKVGGTVQPHDALNDDSGKPTMGFSGSSGILFVPNLNPLPHPNAVKVYVNWFYSKEGQQAMVDTLAQPSHRVDVDMSKLPQWAVPRAGVKYLNLNDERYTSTEQVQAMRDDVNKWYKAP
jgi:ABC-type glycerol-3-phosphate transport system substrate-binding protein